MPRRPDPPDSMRGSRRLSPFGAIRVGDHEEVAREIARISAALRSIAASSGGALGGGLSGIGGSGVSPGGGSFLGGTENPDGGVGAIGDWYINTDTFELFQKTDASTWTSYGIITPSSGSGSVDGGFAASTYTVGEHLDGGGA